MGTPQQLSRADRNTSVNLKTRYHTDKECEYIPPELDTLANLKTELRAVTVPYYMGMGIDTWVNGEMTKDMAKAPIHGRMVVLGQVSGLMEKEKELVQASLRQEEVIKGNPPTTEQHGWHLVLFCVLCQE